MSIRGPLSTKAFALFLELYKARPAEILLSDFFPIARSYLLSEVGEDYNENTLANVLDSVQDKAEFLVKPIDAHQVFSHHNLLQQVLPACWLT